MNTNKNLDKYERIMSVICLIVLAVVLLSSCATSKQNNYQNHLRTTQHERWVKQDNGGCGWHLN